MWANRIQANWSRPKKAIAKGGAAAVAAMPSGFVVCPAQLVAGAWQQAIYRLAYERAKAATQIPRFHRLLFSSWN